MTNVYQAPSVTDLGSFEEITQGGSQSGSLDSQFPVGTPSTNLPGVFS